MFFLKPVFICLILLTFFNVSFAGNRIVSLTPSITEIIYKLGGGKNLVGVTSTCDYPEDAKKKEKIGSYYKPNLEHILSLKPDIVLGMEEGFTQSTKYGLDVLKINNVFYNAENVNEVVALINDIACHINKDGRILTNEITEVFSEKVPVKGSGVMLLSVDPIIAVGSGSFINDIMTCGGFKNILKESRGKYPRMSIEALYKLKPEYILYTKGHGSTDIDALSDRFSKLGLKPRYLAVNPDIFNRASYRIAYACLFLRENIK